MASWRKAIPVSITGEVPHVHDDGTVTVRLHGYDIPVTTRGAHPSCGSGRLGEGYVSRLTAATPVK